MSLKGSFFYFFLSAILGVLLINSKAYYLAIFELVFLIFLVKKKGLSFAFITLAIFLFFLFYRVNSKPSINDTSFTNETFTVLEAKEKYIIVKNDDVKYLIYVTDEYNKNEEIRLSGSVSEIEDDLEIDTFEFKDYLNNKRVYYLISTSKISVVSDDNIASKIRKKLINKLENESLSMTSMLLFNDSSADELTYANLKEINAIHLFVVSGFHISFLFKIISLLFKRNEEVGLLVSTVILGFYVFLLDFSISSTRAAISLILAKLLKDKLNRLDYASIPGLLFLVIEPLNIYNYSFILTFIMIFTIIFLEPFLKKNKILSFFILPFICFLVMAPIQLLLNYKINFISLISNLFLSYIVIGIFILCIIGIPLSLINGDIFSFIYKLFNNGISKIASLNTSLVLGSLKPWMLVIYYFLIILLLLSLEKLDFKKIFLSFICILASFILLYNRNIFWNSEQVIFLNVYQGDCSIIIDSYGKEVALIDTGGLVNYDIANKKIIPYLQYHGIRKIDKVIITHDDYDHCGALETLEENITVSEVIRGDNVDVVNIGNISLTNYNIWTEEADNENDSSLVLGGKIGELYYLFMGDASTLVENEIMDYYETINCDVLKVGHHGSKTSTSSTFLDYLNPTYAIISVGANNDYGHPHTKVLNLLNEREIIIYRTDLNGTIRFSYNNKKLNIEVAKAND